MISNLSIITNLHLNKTTIPTTTFINHFPSNNKNSIIRPYTIQEFEQSLEHPDLFKQRFGLTITKYRSVPDPLQLCDNMLTDPNNFVEKHYEDLLEEGQLYDQHTDLPPVPPQPIQRPKQTVPRRNSSVLNALSAQNARNPNTIISSGDKELKNHMMPAIAKADPILKLRNQLPSLRNPLPQN